MSSALQVSDLSPQLPETGFIRLPTVLRVIPVSRATWWNGVREGKYPQGYKLSPRTTAWKVEDIRQLIQQLANQSASTAKG